MGTHALPASIPFAERLNGAEWGKTLPQLGTLQVNVGRACNLACKHCHLEAGPERSELMERETMRHCLRVLAENKIPSLDITGGAPELNPHLRDFVHEAAQTGARVMLRSNLTLWEDAGHEDWPEFLAARQIEIVASLPFYAAKDTDKQRGAGVFEKVIRALRRLNALGYGREAAFSLNLVYNPGGAFLPPPQQGLENEYKKRLGEQFGIRFNHLFAITNNPGGRFAAFLERSGNLTAYMNRLEGAFNPGTLPGMMCRSQLSVSPDGGLYDCDFNQAVELPAATPRKISEIQGRLPVRPIRFANHCYACTAGSGSSCGGATA
jgi:radical SAM/Cys-rich protein